MSSAATPPRDLADRDIAALRIKALEFQDSDLWRALQGTLLKDRESILATLADEKVPGEELKFAQGKLAQANRDIMLVERFLHKLDAAQQYQRRAAERSV